MAIVVTPKYDDEPFEKMLRRFKNRVKAEEVILEYKKSEYFEKPSDRKRRKNIEAKRQNK